MKKHMHLIHNAQIRVATKWCFPELRDDTVAAEHADLVPNELVAISAEMIRQQGYAEGYSQCQARATLDAEKKIQDFMDYHNQECASQMAELIQNLGRQLEQAEQTLASGVVELACEVARQVLRRELKLDSQSLLPAIQEGMALLLDEAKIVSIRLNPLTLETLEPRLKQTPAWTSVGSVRLVADGHLDLNDCRLECEGRMLDASLTNRWQRVVAQLGLDSSWESAEHEH